MTRPPGVRRPPVIALVGIDGAGKTSQAAALATWLSAQGVPAAHCRNPGGRVALSRLSRRLGRADAVDLLGRRGFVAAEATLRGLAIGRSLLRAWWGRRAAVMDRYTFCQYAAMRARGDVGERWVRAAYRLFPAPDLVCVLRVAPRRAQERIAARGTDTEELAYLRALDRAYRHLPEAAGFTVVDADADQATVFRALTQAVAGLVPARPALPAPRAEAGPRPAGAPH